MAGKTKSLPARRGRIRRHKDVLDVTVVLIGEGYISTAIAPIEVFHSAGMLWNSLQGEQPKPRFRVRVVSADGRSVKGLCGLELTPECAIGDIRQTDIIILSASGWETMDRIAKDTPLLPWLRKWHSRGAVIAGICTGVAFLAESGLLDGREATTHWAVAERMRQRYPKVRWCIDQFVTEDGAVFCSGGVYASIDLSLYLVEKFCGHEVALQCAKSLLVSMPRARQSGYSVVPLSRPHSDERIEQIERYLQKNFDRDVTVGDLASRAGMGQRTFIRRFKAATGRLPGTYLQMLRISAAKELLERGTLSVHDVCARIGYEDVAFFRNLFKRYAGMTPADYRSRFARMNFDRGELAGANALS
ncbi:MAG TPA: helix-turn-helix domain-containing protein [Xanthobacteraceae bacterium]|nr:helix-turn-helix domain-containing protein [Xanthobacteraceae bacterium]